MEKKVYRQPCCDVTHIDCQNSLLADSDKTYSVSNDVIEETNGGFSRSSKSVWDEDEDEDEQ